MRSLLFLMFTVLLVACGSEDEKRDKVSSVYELPEINVDLNTESPEGIWVVSEEAEYQYLVKNSEFIFLDGARDKSTVGLGISKQFLIIKETDVENEVVLKFCNLKFHGDKFSYLDSGITRSEEFSNTDNDINVVDNDTISLSFSNNLSFKGTYSQERSEFEGDLVDQSSRGDYYSNSLREGTLVGVKLSNSTSFIDAKELLLNIAMTAGSYVEEHNNSSSNLDMSCLYVEEINTSGTFNEEPFVGEYLNTGAKFRTQDPLVDGYSHAIFSKEGVHEQVHLSVLAGDVFYNEMLYCNPPDQSCRDGVIIEKNDKTNLSLSFGFLGGILEGIISLSL
jgi:hypothetical protein